MGISSCTCLKNSEEGNFNTQQGIDSELNQNPTANIEQSRKTNLQRQIEYDSENDKEEITMQCYETFRSKYPQETEVTKITEQDYQTILDDFPNIKSILKSKENSLSFRNPSSSENNKDLIELPPIKISSSGNITEYYKGQANKDGERSGEGELLTSDGNYYKGGFSHNAFNGKGIFINNQGNVFEGIWENGQSKGEGEYSLSSGHKYKGNFENNMKNGKGEETYPDGTKYIGEFVNN